MASSADAQRSLDENLLGQSGDNDTGNDVTNTADIVDKVIDHCNAHQNTPYNSNIRSSSSDVGIRYDCEMQMTSSSGPTAINNGTQYENSRPHQTIMTSETTSVITTRDDDVNHITLTSRSETVVDKVRNIIFRASPSRDVVMTTDTMGGPLAYHAPASDAEIGLTDAARIQIERTAEDVEKHPLYIQLDVLCHFEDHDSIGWKEMARWLKYEEKVETGGRWSKPHVCTASLHSIFELRRSIELQSCTLLLDLDVTPTTSPLTLERLADTVTQALVRVPSDDAVTGRRTLSQTELIGLRNILTCPHKHKDRRGIRRQHQQQQQHQPLMAISTQATRSDEKTGEGAELRCQSVVRSTSCQSSVHSQQQQQQNHSHQSSVPYHQRRVSLIKREGKEFWTVHTTYRNGVKPDHLRPYTPNKRLMRKLPTNSEAVSILVGQTDFLSPADEPIHILFRFRSAAVVSELTEVTIPTRFVFLAIGHSVTSSIADLSELGRAVAALFNDKVFCELAYRATTRQDLLVGIDEFLDQLTVLPPSLWDPTTRLEPPEKTLTPSKIWKRVHDVTRRVPSPEPVMDHSDTDQSLRQTGRLFGGLVNDVRAIYRQFASDFVDGLHMQCLASVIFLYFACITPIVTFGGVMGQETEGCMGTMETLVSGAVCGVVYALFAGQPLNIVGATGPLLVFESIVFSMCKENQIDFMSFRFWIGMYIFINLILIVAFDLSSFVRYITRFTEESFAVLISVIFIYEALRKISDIWVASPVRRHAAIDVVGLMASNRSGYSDSCYCVWLPRNDTESTSIRYKEEVYRSTDNDDDDSVIGNISVFSLRDWTERLPEHCVTFQGRIAVSAGCSDEKSCYMNGWTPIGQACYMTPAVPDVFLLSCVLFCGTFAVAYFLRTFRTTRYFPTQVRTVLGDFAVFFAVTLWTSVDIYFGLATPKLNVPSKFETTNRNRGWIVSPLAVTYWWLIPLAAAPGILGTILVFLDHQITTVIVNRKEHKLKKRCGYHLDIFVLAWLIAVCSLLGLPWFVAATVRAITHVRSLMVESQVKAPGDRPQMLGVREQRVTGICIHVLIGCSIFLTFILQRIPMPVLYGVFMYMGVTSLKGIQFVERILIMFMPVKYQPDYIYLRHVQTSRVHYFTLVQIVCSAVMWSIKSIKSTSIAFPIMLLALIATRKLMDYVFTQRELYWLDHLLPDESRRKKEDQARATIEQQHHQHHESIGAKHDEDSNLQPDFTENASNNHDLTHHVVTLQSDIGGHSHAIRSRNPAAVESMI